MKRATFISLLVFMSVNLMAKATETANLNQNNLRVATFNVSMESLNYIENKSEIKNTSADSLSQNLNKALLSSHQQIKNIAEIIQRVNPDIILLNEFDRTNESHINLKLFLQRYLAKSQHGQKAVQYPYFYQGAVNTGVKVTDVKVALNKTSNEKEIKHGFGFFPGHFGMALLSKYPINYDKIRTFQLFKWHDMPNALQPFTVDANNNKLKKMWYSAEVWRALRLSSKSHWDIPVNVKGKVVHILASHPTPPVFDGKEDRNGKRNHDEIRFWLDYITPNKGSYIYDDNKQYGGLSADQSFIILGDQNASSVEGDAINSSIANLLSSNLTQDVMPKSDGGKTHSPENSHGKHHTAYWRMRADYVLPSVKGLTPVNSGVFWPLPSNNTYRLIKDRSASSDHRLVWVDVELD